MHAVKILIRLLECAGWSESSLGAHIRKVRFLTLRLIYFLFCVERVAVQLTEIIRSNNARTHTQQQQQKGVITLKNRIVLIRIVRTQPSFFNSIQERKDPNQRRLYGCTRLLESWGKLHKEKRFHIALCSDLSLLCNGMFVWSAFWNVFQNDTIFKLRISRKNNCFNDWFCVLWSFLHNARRLRTTK